MEQGLYIKLSIKAVYLEWLNILHLVDIEGCPVLFID